MNPWKPGQSAIQTDLSRDPLTMDDSKKKKEKEEVEYSDHSSSKAMAKLVRCIPKIPRSADQDVYLHPVEEAGITVHPDQARLSRRLRTMRR